jgi:hypothetical protein
MPETSATAKSKSPRNLASKAERALKDATKIGAKQPDATPEQKSLMQVEQAKVLALLELAASIRSAKGQ